MDVERGKVWGEWGVGQEGVPVLRAQLGFDGRHLSWWTVGTRWSTFEPVECDYVAFRRERVRKARRKNRLKCAHAQGWVGAFWVYEWCASGVGAWRGGVGAWPGGAGRGWRERKWSGSLRGAVGRGAWAATWDRLEQGKKEWGGWVR